MIVGGATAIALVLAAYFGYQFYNRKPVTPVALLSPETAAGDTDVAATPPAGDTVLQTDATSDADADAETTAGSDTQTTADAAGDQPADDQAATETPPATLPVPAPKFDVVRVEPDGSSVIAGMALPGTEVTILLDGRELTRATADGQGNFVALLTLPPSNTARVLALSIPGQDDAPVVSKDSVILAPVAEPELPDTTDLLASADQTGADETPDSASGQSATDNGDNLGDAENDAAPETTAEGEAAPQAADEPSQTQAVQTATDTETTAQTAATPENEQTPPPAKAPAVLLATDEGVRVLQPADSSPEMVTNVVIDAISYDAGGEVQLSGRGTGAEDGFVRVYLDNKPVLTTPVGAGGGWHTGLPDVDSGIYTLRVDQVDASGVVISRTETPFKRETAEVLQNAQRDPQSPAIVVTVQPGSTLWAIARETYGDGMMYVRVFEANRNSIRDPDLIYPGQVFAVPD